ncbi:hypothetical protein MLD38_027789 [Melastoma candidum]|uniref:Uncharacterized protein n=1 Tax=Melastoma candidum TaxID=119954 RepID=A0ACB9P768_9MYRT|nr:hypothetical protein MLD38_027789 [Melastoma candidum]
MKRPKQLTGQKNSTNQIESTVHVGVKVREFYLDRAHKNLVEIGSWETSMKASVEALINKAEEDTEKKKAEHAAKFRIKISELHKEAETRRVTITSRRGEDVTKVEDRATKFWSTGYVPHDLFHGKTAAMDARECLLPYILPFVLSASRKLM